MLTVCCQQLSGSLAFSNLISLKEHATMNTGQHENPPITHDNSLTAEGLKTLGS